MTNEEKEHSERVKKIVKVANMYNARFGLLSLAIIIGSLFLFIWATIVFAFKVLATGVLLFFVTKYVTSVLDKLTEKNEEKMKQKAETNV